MYRVDENNDRTADREPPEHHGYDNLMLLLRHNPLHDKAGKEDKLPEESEEYPGVK